MAARAGGSGASEALGDVIWLLLDQARLMDGETLNDPSAFGKRVNSVLTSAIG
jgi:molecular chaperone HtpG